MFLTSASLPLTLKFYLPAEPSILKHPQIFYHANNSTVVFECIQISWHHRSSNHTLKALWRLFQKKKKKLSQWFYFIKMFIVLPNIYLVIFLIWMHFLALSNCLLSSVQSYAYTNAIITNFIKKPGCIAKRGRGVPSNGISNAYLNSLSTLSSFLID